MQRWSKRALLAYLFVGTAALATMLSYAIFSHKAADASTAPDHAELSDTWIFGAAPFVLLLLAIAVLPLLRSTAHWWESNPHRYAVSMTAALLAVLYGICNDGISVAAVRLEHAVLLEYIPFIVLLLSLFVVAGSIRIQTPLRGTPLHNALILAIGTLIASFFGTTGAAMILIRPLLASNAHRTQRAHTIVFFIFLVCNCGGTLLPIGDPPLFMGYLKGVPFFWTLSLWKEWMVVSLIVLAVYFALDFFLSRKEIAPSNTQTAPTPFRIEGSSNFLLLLGILAAVILVDPSRDIPGTTFRPFLYMRELLMLAILGVSLRCTHKSVRDANQFSWSAIVEVAAIFIGVFVSMQVPLEVLRWSGPTLGLTHASHFFWTTGFLSSMLDNAPTYLVFLEVAKTIPADATHTMVPLTEGFVREDLLTAVSLGAVFMGALTYIGNGPNFMVRSIAEASGTRMPSFFSYAFWACVVLIPAFLCASFLIPSLKP
ncbi:MAG: sodium:proton antiporter [Phycisphaerales bacterium]|nr:sodium:proton antiporter [Phycisphaerales bacterium]